MQNPNRSLGTLKWGKMLEIPVKCIVSSVNPYFTPFFWISDPIISKIVNPGGGPGITFFQKFLKLQKIHHKMSNHVYLYVIANFRPLCSHIQARSFSKKITFWKSHFCEFCKILIFGNFWHFGKCKTRIDPWGTLKWGQSPENWGKMNSLFRKSRFWPHFSQFWTLTFPKNRPLRSRGPFF